jgi:NAD(P)-dependent dehydrogenase (short-subunit alcohol dehydrogenase family)
MNDLNNKVAVITGAASGLGLAMAHRFGAEGMRIVLADIERAPLELAEAALRAQGVEVVALVTDVSDAAQVDALADHAFERFGAVHVLCNNAGVAGGGTAWETSLATWEWVLGVNLWGVIHGLRSFVGRMVDQGEGHIVNTASLAGLVAAPGLAAYNATKHAVVGLSETLHHELATSRAKVRVSVLCPGFVQTRIHDSARNWPTRLGPAPQRSHDGGDVVRQLVESGMDPSVVAEAVVDAIRSQRFWILTHEAASGRVLERFRGAVEGRDPSLAWES